uniref:Phosphoribosylanthranilate isomerase n=1 Tax=Phaeocystis antarctica TaxID=33657 RepID=A0A7S0EXA0_9EUKA|mmetsp:Transcript_32603/g.77073  ORF Transcript_32603/g.77073 Transcript_32603/m.77073 type:complete len:281 (+) Transcript_32603:2-844(+)
MKLDAKMEASRPSHSGGADDPIRLRCLGFCGADDTVEPAALKQISERHGWVEWGILFRPDKAGSARFASDEWLTRLGQVNSAGRMRLAGHLCATHVDDLLRGDTSFVRKLRDAGFQRLQVNATAANGADVTLFADAAGAAACGEALLQAMRAVPEVEFILQRNSLTRPLWAPFLEQSAPPPNMSMLFDESMGMGVTGGAWHAPPPPHISFGYAGGLSPDNITEQLARIAEVAPGRELWVDMETGVRSGLPDGSDVFDLAKCLSCLEQVVKLELAPTPAVP